MKTVSLISSLAIALAGFQALAVELSDYHGVYLGYAVVNDGPGGGFREREMTVKIEPYKTNGIEISWTSVELVEGRRDKAGVTYREDQLLLLPSDNSEYYIASATHKPFEQRQQDQPIAGDPLRWATLSEQGLQVFSFVILDDGRYELQRYNRQLDQDGMSLSFERIVDDEVKREISGYARRAIQ